MKHILTYLAIGFLITSCSVSKNITVSTPAVKQPVEQNTSTGEMQTTETLVLSATVSPEIDQARITLENADKLVEISVFPFENARLLAWLPGSDSLAVASMNSIRIVDARDFSTIKEYKSPDDSALLDFNAASQRAIFSSDRQNLSIRDLTGREKKKITLTSGFGSATFNPDGSRVWVSSLEEFKAVAYDIQSGMEVSSCGGFETAAPVYTVFPSPAGKWLVWMARASIQLNDLENCRMTAHIGHEDFIISHAFNSDESILATSAGGTVDGKFQPLIFLWDATYGSLLRNIILNEAPARSLAFSAGDDLLVSAGNGLFVWDSDFGRQVKELAPQDQQYSIATFSKNGRYLAAATETDVHLFAIKP
ncbi:MAG: hypothetical protein GYA15_08200 [Leptolinea sp.]|nr:hypothetical protein [Leptolinea sp.]